MIAQSERISSRQPFSRERRRAHAPRRRFDANVPASTPEKPKWSFLALLQKLSLTVGVVVPILALGTWFLIGFVLGKVSPECMVTIQPFEIPPAIAGHLSLSGKNAADIVADTLNDAATHASEFHGTEYYKYNNTGTQPLDLHQAIKIPLETSYDIQLNGISLDSVLRFYHGIRYQLWTISGDVLSSPQGLIGRIRLNQGDTAKSWETAPSAHGSPSELIREATCMMLTSVKPELLGQSYLQQGNYEDAARVFRQWENDDSGNWKPSYYLSLTYGYQGKKQEASDLANWSRNIAGRERKSSAKEPVEPLGSGNALASNLASTAKLILATSNVSSSRRATPSENQNRLARLQQAEVELGKLSVSDPSNVDYWIEGAVVLDNEAQIESDLNPNSSQPCAWAHQAIAALDKAIKKVPENGGLYEQRAIFLQHLVDLMKKQGKESPAISLKEAEEVKEYTRALELRPTETSPLWGAVYAQLDLGHADEAVDLARTITLLQPGSTVASTAYIVALNKVSQKEPEKQKEVQIRLKQLLPSKIDKTQLETLWHAFKETHYQAGLDLVGADGKRRFPTDATFAECRPSAGLNRHTGHNPEVRGNVEKTFVLASLSRLDAR